MISSGAPMTRKATYRDRAPIPLGTPRGHARISLREPSPEPGPVPGSPCLASGATVAFRVCGERVEVPARPRRCENSLLGVLIGGDTELGDARMQRNAAGEIPITSASSAASFRALARFVTLLTPPTRALDVMDDEVLQGGPSAVLAALFAMCSDMEIFLGSTSADSDLDDFTDALRQQAEKLGASDSPLVRDPTVVRQTPRGMQPNVANPPGDQMRPHAHAPVAVTTALPVSGWMRPERPYSLRGRTACVRRLRVVAKNVRSSSMTTWVFPLVLFLMFLADVMLLSKVLFVHGSEVHEANKIHGLWDLGN